MRNKNHCWLEIQLYYGEPYERFLRESVIPFVDMVLQNSLAEQFSFMRYQFRGPHIKLRFKGNRNSMNKYLVPLIVENFESYFKKVPSIREEKDILKDLHDGFKWFPNNSIQFTEYIPEMDRYGGPTGFEISEKQFQLSSETAFAIIRENCEWGYDQALSSGVQLNLALLYSSQMKYNEMILFLESFFDIWYKSIYIFKQENNISDERERRKKIIDVFEDNFQNQKKDLVNYFSDLFNILRNGDTVDTGWVDRWIEGISVIVSNLKNSISNGTIALDKWFVPVANKNISKEQQVLWSILYSYVHMTNNRLGILNSDESYSAYLIKRGIESL